MCPASVLRRSQALNALLAIKKVLCSRGGRRKRRGAMRLRLWNGQLYDETQNATCIAAHGKGTGKKECRRGAV
jgi:hypothetical protein